MLKGNPPIVEVYFYFYIKHRRMDTMKTKILYSFIAITILAMAISCGNQYGGKWIAKIDDETITDNELNA